MMTPISLIENKNTNGYIMQDLDLKYLHKKKPCINPFRWWRSRAGSHRGQRVSREFLAEISKWTVYQNSFFRRVSSRFIQFYLKMIKTRLTAKQATEEEFIEGQGRGSSPPVYANVVAAVRQARGSFTGCFWLWHVWGCETSGWWTAQTFCCSRQRGTRTGGLQCECVHVCAS